MSSLRSQGTGFEGRGKTKMSTFHTDLCNHKGSDASSSDVLKGEMLNRALRAKGNIVKTEGKKCDTGK